METENYILGSVGIPGYPEHYDAHVFVNTEGWILAYYMKDAPTSKIADVIGKTAQSTNLKTAVSITANAAGAAFTDVEYYDFRYPNATNILFIAEDEADGLSFTIRPPSDYGYYEKSWAVSHNYQDFFINGIDHANNPLFSDGNYRIAYGKLTSSHLIPNITHTVSISPYSYGVLTITYSYRDTD